MRFDYAPYGGSWLPLIPVVFSREKKSLPAVGALVDTGATHTVLPMEMALPLGISVNVTDQIETQIAGGGQCIVYLSPVSIEFILKEPDSDKEYRWKGQVLFALGQKFVLLGHHQCLENFDVLFRGRQRVLEIERAKSRR